MRKTIGLVCYITMCFFMYVTVSNAEKIGLEAGNKAPDFQLNQLEGDPISLSDYKGQPVFLNFWATWCPPCREEMPDLQKFYENTDAVVLAVNLTDTEMSVKQVQDFIGKYKIYFPVILDENGEVANLYKIRPIPTTYIIDSEGIIREKVYGGMTYEQLMREYSKIEKER